MLEIYLILFLIISLSINISIFILYTKKRGKKQLIKKLSLKKTEKKKFEPLKIPEIYTKNNLSLSFKNNVKTQNDFNGWKKNIISKFQELHKISNLDQICISEIKKIFVKKYNNYTITKFSTKAQDDDNIFFYQLIPTKIEKNNTTVFVIPGSGNQGAKDVCNIASKDSEFYYQQEIGIKLVNEGYIVYVIENRGWGERTINTNLCDELDPFCSGEVLERQIKNLGLDLINLQITDTLQIFKSLLSFNLGNSENIFLLGIGHGGKIALRSSLFLNNLKGILLSSSLFSTNFFGTFGNGYTHGFLKYFDNPDLAITFAPKPIYLSWGLNENPPHSFEAQSSHSSNMIKSAYSIFNQEKNLTSIIHHQTINSGHTVDPSSILTFIKNNIKSG
tara:strand:- start:2673 stop:3842 length:1170 start_codon:yes stop_codon:yes gene_type:complete